MSKEVPGRHSDPPAFDATEHPETQQIYQIPSELPIEVDSGTWPQGEIAFKTCPKHGEDEEQQRMSGQAQTVSVADHYFVSSAVCSIPLLGNGTKLCNMKLMNYLPPSFISVTILPPQVIR